MNDEFTPPIATQPEDLYADLREQTAVMRLSEGLLAYAGSDFASPAIDDPDVSESGSAEAALSIP